MKAIVLALACGVLLVACVSVCFNRGLTGSHLKVLIHAYLIFLFFLVVAHAGTPDDLGFLPVETLTPFWWLDLGFSIFLFSAGFFGGVLQLYNLAERGLSLSMLIDILHSPEGSVTAEGETIGYSASRGIGWMYQKRIDGMLAADLIRVSGDDVALTPPGETVASVFSGLQEFAGVHPGKAGSR